MAPGGTFQTTEKIEQSVFPDRGAHEGDKVALVPHRGSDL